MTVREAASRFGIRVMKASSGDNLYTLVDRIYASRDEVYYMVLQTLNDRFDWDMVEPGAEIKFIPKIYCADINEITS